MEQFVEFIGNNTWMALLWVTCFVLLISSFVTSATSGVKTISTHDMTMLVNRSNGQIVDIRADAEFKKGHITDAFNLPLTKITSEEFGKLESHKNDPIVVVCNAGISAKNAAKSLQKSGFEQVSVLQGGMQTWVGANLPVVQGK